MSPGRPAAVTGDLLEKDGWHGLACLDEVFTDQESTDDEGWATTNPSLH